MSSSASSKSADDVFLRDLIGALDLQVDVRRHQNLLDRTLVTTASSSLHDGRGGGQVSDEHELGSSGDGVASVVHSVASEAAVHDLVAELLQELGHAAGTLGSELQVGGASLSVGGGHPVDLAVVVKDSLPSVSNLRRKKKTK